MPRIATEEFENRASSLEDLASQGLSAVSRTVRAWEGHAEETVQDVTMRLSALEKDTEGHHVWTMKKIQKLEDESRTAVSCMEHVMRDRQVMKRDFDELRSEARSSVTLAGLIGRSRPASPAQA